MEYDSAVKSSQLLINATTWIHLNNIMLSEKGKTHTNTKRNNIKLFCLYEMTRKEKSTVAESKSEVAGG